MLLLVGDNPFQGISHLSQARVRSKDQQVLNPAPAAELVLLAVDNGADGFMFSVSDSTLSILSRIGEHAPCKSLDLVALVPYAYEYVRKATVMGPVGLSKRLATDILGTQNLNALLHLVRAYFSSDLSEGMRSLIDYELSRIKRATNGRFKLHSLMLHEVIVDTLAAYGLTHLLVDALKYIDRKGIIPGLETRNLPLVLKLLREESSVFGKTIFATPFNKVGFQMGGKSTEYEEAVKQFSGKVIAMSVLAAGYLRIEDAVQYLAGFRNDLLGVVIGVSGARHAAEDFALARTALGHE